MYRCPKCGEDMHIEKRDNRVHITCRCGLHTTMKWGGEINSAFLRFLARYDEGKNIDRINLANTFTTWQALHGPRHSVPTKPNNSDGHHILPAERPVRKTTSQGTAQDHPAADRATGRPAPQGTAQDHTGGIAEQPALDKAKLDSPDGQHTRPARPDDTTSASPRSMQQKTAAGHQRHDTPGQEVDAASIGQKNKIRSGADIKDMIKKYRPDRMMRDILNTRQDYVCWYRAYESPGLESGSSVHDMNLHANLAACLHDDGIHTLHKFQQESYDCIVAGEDTVIVAPTASGKTEAFLIPLLQMLAEGRQAVFALVVYPTKALARDQHHKIQKMAASIGARSEIFDGDTPQDKRRNILRYPPHILVTNFDVIDYHLPRRTRFARLLYTVRMIVIDEVHVYSGIFGSNIHHVLRRLDRVCGRLQMVAASATVDRPAEFCSQLLDRDVRVVQTDGRKGRMEMAMLAPTGHTQHSMMLELTNMMTGVGHKTMVFSNSHRGAEMFAIAAKKKGVDIRVHRSGLSTSYRRQTEDLFRNGVLMAISCTPTLELGIDMGTVDGVVSTVVPVNRLLQRVGRAARKGQTGYALLALGDDPISQYYMNRPEDYFDDVEALYIDPINPIVLRYHLSMMALDARTCARDIPPQHLPVLQDCIDEGLLYNRDGVLVPDVIKTAGLMDDYNIRGMGRTVPIMLDGKIVGERVLPMALGELHPGATYYMAGAAYVVESLDAVGLSRATLRPAPLNYPHTKPLMHDDASIQSILDTKRVWNMQVAHCNLMIRRTVTGYVATHNKKDDAIPLKIPISFDFETKGVVFCAPYIEGDDAAAAYHAAEHAIIEGSNMITGGAARDLSGISMGESGAIFVYDTSVGGNGASRALYDRMTMAIRRSAKMLEMCPCRIKSGCPRCTHSYRCGENNDRLHKVMALDVLNRIIGGAKSDLDVPEGGYRALV